MTASRSKAQFRHAQFILSDTNGGEAIGRCLQWRRAWRYQPSLDRLISHNFMHLLMQVLPMSASLENLTLSLNRTIRLVLLVPTALHHLYDVYFLVFYVNGDALDQQRHSVLSSLSCVTVLKLPHNLAWLLSCNLQRVIVPEPLSDTDKGLAGSSEHLFRSRKILI